MSSPWNEVSFLILPSSAGSLGAPPSPSPSRSGTASISYTALTEFSTWVAQEPDIYFPPFCRLEAQDRGVSRVAPPRGWINKNLCAVLKWLLRVSGSLSPWSSARVLARLVSVCVQAMIAPHSHWVKPTPSDLILTHFTYLKTLFSKYSPRLKCRC